MRAIFQNTRRAVSLHKVLFPKIFVQFVQYVTVCLVWIWTGDVEAEAVKVALKEKKEAIKWYRFRFYFGHSYQTLKTLMWCNFL